MIDPRLIEADGLVLRGERAAARVLLAAVVAQDAAARRPAIMRLAQLEEAEGDLGAAAARWQELLADDIDDDSAWAHLGRLAAAPGEATPPRGPRVGPAAPTLEGGIGVRVQRFEITGELGRGAFGTVYRARDRQLDLPLALKVLHPQSDRDREAARRRDEAYFAEVRRVAALRHPGLCAFYDIDEAARILAMELVPGGTLRTRLRPSGRPVALPLPELTALGAGLGAALAQLHDEGLLHGDLSPRNVLLRRPGEPVLIDFGSPRLGGLRDQPAGTPLYLAPEQFQGAPPSAAADLFAAGAILFEAAAGHPLRTREDLMTGRTGPRPLPARELAPDERAAWAALEHLIAVLTSPAPTIRYGYRLVAG